MRTLFIGSTRRGFLSLKALLEASVPVAGILSLTQAPHEIERYEAHFRQLAAERNIPIREASQLKDPGLVDWVVRVIRAEVAFAIGLRVLMPEPLWAACPKGCWAAHDSLLPAYRGFAPLNWSIINGETETGVTLFKIDAGMDTGDILLQQQVPIGADETAPQIYEKICAATLSVVVEGFRLLQDDVRPQTQDPSLASYTCSRIPEDSLIDWCQPTRTIHNLIRALTFPYPGAFTYIKNRRIYVLSARPGPETPPYVGRIPGRVIQVSPDGWVDVLTGDGVLRLMDISLDGRTLLKPSEVIRSVRSRLGINYAAMMEFFLPQTPALDS